MGGGSRSETSLTKVDALQRKLRRAQARIETLRERNLILKSRIKMISRHGGVEAIRPENDLSGFDSGVVIDVPIDSRRQSPMPAKRPDIPGREDVLNKIDLRPEARKAEIPQRIGGTSQIANKLPAKRQFSGDAHPIVHGEQADRALVRTIIALLKEKDFLEAERTAGLLEKSYPQSPALAEAKFQLGLGYFRSQRRMPEALQKADGRFTEALAISSSHIRVKAGATLMRGIIAKRIGLPVGDRRNLDLAKRNFEYVMMQYPRTSEARRARAELAAMNRSVK